MSRCLQLAELGAGNVAPNPMVGAVLVHNNIIISEGYHRKYGGPHAEADCLSRVAKEDISLIPECTLYVSLEPCTHLGKTPPCTDLIIREGIKKVVIGCNDPFEKVNGSGVSMLRAAGVNVVTNILEQQAIFLNRRFFTFHKKQRPYIILKWAQSSDGKIGSFEKRLNISNQYSNILVHKWRSEESAILIGTNTAVSDEPLLTVRNWSGINPLRVIIDRHLRVSAESSLLTDEEPLLIINSLRNEEHGNKTYYKGGKDDNLIAVALNLLHMRNIISLIVEGGAQVHRSFIQAGLWDEIRIITNTEMIIGTGIEAAPLPVNAKLSDSIEVGSDLVQIFLNIESQ